MLLLKIDHDGVTAWHKCAACNPDDALTDLAIRGVYDFERGDTLKKVVQVRETDTGHKLESYEDDNDA
jgi:hypothetical protein